VENFSCPMCGIKIEKTHAYFLNNFTTIECTKCHSKLEPELMKMAGIGAMFGTIGGLIGFSIPTILIILGKPLIGMVFTLFLGVVIYFIVVNRTYHSIRFRLKE